MLTFRRMREAAFLGDRDKIAELMNFHRATLRCERRFVEVPAFFAGLPLARLSAVRSELWIMKALIDFGWHGREILQWRNAGDLIVDHFAITHNTRVIEGVNCVEVQDSVYSNGALTKDTSTGLRRTVKTGHR